MKTLAGQSLRHKDYIDLEEQIADLMWRLLFRPVLAVLGKDAPKAIVKDLKALENVSQEPLLKALRDGVVQVSKDPKTGKAIISGKFNRAISDAIKSFGATFDSRRGVYSCELGTIPTNIRLEGEGYATRAKQAHEDVKKVLDDLEVNVKKQVDDFKLHPEKAIGSVEAGWKEAAKSLEVLPGLDAAGREALAKKMEESAKIPIKDWAQASIDRLREQVTDNAAHGYRMESLAARIKNEHGASRAKARFIARQETAIFMSDFREARAQEIGCTRYKWDASGDERTRADHKALDGQVFFYSEPPIVDRKTGRRANPGKDFNCRCVDIPILNTPVLAKAVK